jgi:multisubunit Na+/H+ antiporter MnhB subunit
MQGLGTLGAGLILTAVAFPRGARRSEVAEDILLHMGWLYLVVGLALIVLTTVALRFHRYDRSSHEANLRILELRAGRFEERTIADNAERQDQPRSRQ